MERFTINIDNALKAKIYELCRLCGMDSENRIKILDNSSVAYADGEAELQKKIFECVGIQVRLPHPTSHCNNRRLPSREIWHRWHFVSHF